MMATFSTRSQKELVRLLEQAMEERDQREQARVARIVRLREHAARPPGQKASPVRAKKR
jgi:hypothetical protein